MVKETRFLDVDLSTSIGLDSVSIEKGPGLFADLRTLLQSKGKLPDWFMTYAGVSAEAAQYLNDLAADNPIQYYRCFVSHSSKDADFVETLWGDLTDAGIDTWYFPVHATGEQASGTKSVAPSRYSPSSFWCAPGTPSTAGRCSANWSARCKERTLNTHAVKRIGSSFRSRLMDIYSTSGSIRGRQTFVK